MEIRDVIHGSVEIEPGELPVIDSRYFQRLRQIKQLGFAEYSFPSATHNRYIHSLGAMRTAASAFERIFGGKALLDRRAYSRLRAVTRLAALLHDVGHGPLSHTTEFAMPEVAKLDLPAFVSPAPRDGKSRKATHEDYTLKIILDSALTPFLQRAGEEHGFTPAHIAALIDGDLKLPQGAEFFEEIIDGEKIDFRPILKQLISSELDADRMDYLQRDSLHAGVSYGQFDFDWLVGNLSYHLHAGKCYLALQHRALYAFEDFLISRFHMFLMVYFHYKSVIFDETLKHYLESPDCDYSIPADIEKYAECDDANLYANLNRSKNIWARRIVDKNTYRMLIELHSGIPAGAQAASEQQKLIESMKKDLDSKKIHYIIATTTGELSKYFRKPGDPIFVRYDNHYSQPSAIPLEQCTDLFNRYSEKRSITRLYVSPEDYGSVKHGGRSTPFKHL